MKVAIIAPTEIPSRRANTIQVLKMAQALTAQGRNVVLAAPLSPQMQESTWEQLAPHYGLQRRFELTWLSADPMLRRYDYSWKAVRWARRQNAELIYTRLPQAAALSSHLGVPTILEIHDLPQGLAGPWLFRKFLSGKGARRVVIITRALAADLGRDFNIRLDPPFGLVAPDGVDLERYSCVPSPEQARRKIIAAASQSLARLDPNRFTIGYTGHLYPGRGTNLLLDLAERMQEIAMLIVGGEPDHVKLLDEEAKRRKLSNLFLTGFIPNADLPLYQAACDVLLMPYRRKVEGSSGGDISRYLSPMKLFEYMACERAIISSDLPVLREVLNPQNSILVPIDQADGWEAAVRLLRDNLNLSRRLSLQARKDAEQYTWERRASRILEGIESNP